jgi:HEAT repeat protein
LPFILSLGCFALAWSLSSGTIAVADEPTPELVKMVVGLLHEKDKDLRAVGLDQVRGEIKGTTATATFAGELPKLSPEAQAGLISALADRGDAAALPSVLTLMTGSTDEAVRTAAVRAIGKLGTAEQVPPLTALLTDDSAGLSAAARESLTALSGADAVKAIVAGLNQANEPTQIALIEILTTRRALDAVDDLVKLAQGDTPKVRTAAISALAQLADRKHVSCLLAAVLKAERGAERDAAERAVVAVCSRGDDKQPADELIMVTLADIEPGLQTQLLSTLGRVGGKKALERLESAIASDDAEERAQGLRGLCNWPDASTADRMIELIKDETFAAQRPALINALIRVAVATDGRTEAERLARLQQALSLCETDAQSNEVLRRAQTIC